MSQSERPPPMEPRMRTPLKVVAVVIGYAIYRTVLGDDDRIAAPLLIAGGFVALAYVMVNRWTTRSADLSGLIQTGTTILGLGLLGLGTVLLVTD
jgi:hypothetical protein